MERIVTLDWLNCLNINRNKLYKLTDAALADHLFDLLIRFQFCTQDCNKYSKEEKKKLIGKFLQTKIKDYNYNRLFIDEDNLLIACWLFLFHIVWCLEDATLRNHLSFHLENSSQEFIKSFLERMQEQNEINENNVRQCLAHAAEKCAHLERSPSEFVSSSANSTPNNQTPTGIKRKMSLTLREFLLSPNAQKKFVEEHTKELKRVKLELTNEINEKIEVMDENVKLKKKMDQITKQLEMKQNENNKLRREIETIESNLNEAASAKVKLPVDNREINDLQMRLEELQLYVTTLEKENDSISKQLSCREKNIISISEECNSLKNQFAELQLALVSKEEIIERVSKDKEFFKTEMNNLKEFNQALTEKVALLESTRSSPTEELKAPNLESEMQFQLMKDTIEWAKKNMTIIETEQTRLMNDNRSLNERVKNLVDERKEIDSTMKDLNDRIDTLKNENIAWKTAKETLSKKLKHIETKLTNTNRDFESYKTQTESSAQKLLEEKEHLHGEIHHLNRSLEQYATLCDDLHDREEYLMADNERLESELGKTRDQLSHNETLLEDFNAQMEQVKSENLKLSMKLNDMESQNKTLTAKLSDSSKEKAKLHKNREEAERKLAKNKETIESLVKQASQEQDRSTELTKMVEIHLKKIEQSENSLKKLEEDRLDLNKRIGILNEELKLIDSRHRYETEAHNNTKAKLTELERISADQKSTNEQLETDLKFKQLENKTLVCKVKELEEYLNKTEHDNKKLKNSMDELTKEKEKIAVDCSTLEQKLNVDQEIIQSLNDQLTQVQNKRDDLERNIESLTRQLGSERDMIRELQAENTKLVDQFNDLTIELKNAHVLCHNERKINETLHLEINDLQRIVAEQRVQIDDAQKERDSLSSVNYTLEEKLRKTERELKFDRDQLTKYKEDVEFLQNEQKTLRDELSSLEATLTSAEAKNQQLEGSIEEIRREKHLLEESQSQLQKESIILKDSLEKVESEKQIVSNQLTDLTHQHENLLNERISLIESIDGYKSQVPSLTQEISSLRAEIDQLNTANESLNHQLVQLTSQMQSVEAEKLATTAQYDSLAQQLQNLENTYSDMIKNKQQIEKTALERQNLIETLQNDLSSASALNTQLNEKLQRLENDMSNLRNELDHFVEKSSHLEKEKDSLQGTVTRLEAANQLLSTNYDQLAQQKQSECDQYESKIVAMNEDVIKIRNLLEEINQTNETQLKTLQSTESTLQQTQAEKEALEKQYSALIEQKEHIDSEYKNQTNHVEKLQDKIAELEKLFSNQTTEMKLLKSDYDRSNDENQRFTEQLKELSNNVCELQERLKASVQETETLDQEKKSLLKKILDFENSFDEIQQRNETLSKNLQDVVAEKQAALEEKNDLAKCTEDRDMIIKKLNSEITELQSRIDKLSGENRGFEDQLKLAESALSSMKEEKQGFEEKYEKIYEEMIEIQGRYETAKENNSKLQFKIAHMEEVNESQKVQIKQLEENLSSQNSKLSNVENELTALIEQQNSETSAIKTENERLLEENKKYVEAVKRLEELQTERESLLCTLEQKESELNEITSRWQAELNTMKEERTRDAEKITELLDSCKTQQKTVSALSEELVELQKSYEELNESKTRAMNELREMFLLQIDQLLSSNESLKNENAKLLESNTEKAWYLKEMHKRVKPIIEALEEHEKKILQLKEQNDALTKEIDECNGNKWTLKSRNEQLTVLVAQTDEEKQRLDQEIQNLKDEKEILRYKTEELKMDNEEIQNDNNRLRKLMRKESAEHEELKKQTEILSENVKKLQQDSEKVIRENDQLKQYIDQLKEEKDREIKVKDTEIDRFKTSVKELQSEVETLRSKEANLDENNEKLLQERNTMLDQKIMFEQDNIKLKRRLEEVTAQKNELYSMNELNSKAFENRIQSLISNNDDQLVAIQNLKGENEVLRSEMEAVKTNAAVSTRKQVEKLEKKIEGLVQQHMKEIESLTEANNCLKVEIEETKSKLKDHEELISAKETLTKRVDELKMKLDESLEQNERLTDEANLRTDKIAAIVNENENLLAKVDELETKVDTLTDTVSKKDGEILLLQDEYRIFKDEYRKLSEHKNELDKDWKESLIDNFKSASAKCDELKEANRKLIDEVAEKQSAIVVLKAEIEKIKENGVNLNETRVIASGPDNKTNTILKEENQKLIEEIRNLKTKMLTMKAFVEKEKEAYRQKTEKLYPTLTKKLESEYAGKLERAKTEYSKIILKKCSAKEAEWKKKEEDYQKMLRREKDQIRDLNSQLWNMSDKCLSLQQQSVQGLPPNDFRRYSVDNFYSPGTLSRRAQSATNLNMMDSRFQKPLDFDRRLSTMSEDFLPKNRKPLSLTSGKKFLSSAKVFPTEDEEMEIFDNACLADLKQGRMADDSDFSKQRLSVLQARNSLAPPHLKSSYPAETQFIPLNEFKENDIKMGLSSCETEHSDIENLLPGDRSRKNRNQTSYKKPGPPTPSKHGGRASTIGVETPRNVLKESNDNSTARRKSFTPRGTLGLFTNFFPVRGHATVTAAPSQHNNQDEVSLKLRLLASTMFLLLIAFLLSYYQIQV
ncbi:interaptin-like isoform X2 [Planococcus citri]|uniref:interaptin-like isoform X2 n=1 Tax=Planococcus citri TaxID=170843 RepID=UPI0031F9A3B8